MHLDDLFNGLALACLIGYTTCYDIVLGILDYPTIEKFEEAISLLLWTTLYLVKGSFLALCWNIFKVSSRFRILWRFVVVYNILTYLAIILWVMWPCYKPFDPSTPCSLSPSDDSWSHATGSALEAAFHSTSEALILLLPLIWIKTLQMSTAQKLGAISVFAVIIIDIVMGLLRNITTSLYYRGYSFDTLLVITNVMVVLEPSLAVIVCALPVYKVLLPGSRRRRRLAKSPILNNAEPPVPVLKNKPRQNSDADTCPSQTRTAEVVEMV